jgi:gamma-glutamyl-gamma-aminobutyrate hydrolase PuuD
MYLAGSIPASLNRGDRTPMPRIGITQRRLRPSPGGLIRDALGIEWPRFLRACGAVSVPLPNDAELAVRFASELDLAALVLSGGEAITPYGGRSRERDSAESALLAWATEHRVPVVGVCRGMQVIVTHFGGTLVRVEGHQRSRNVIKMNGTSRIIGCNHRRGVVSLPSEVAATATCGNLVEGIRHHTLPFVGVMWHPEREVDPNPHDIQIFRAAFGIAEPGSTA